MSDKPLLLDMSNEQTPKTMKKALRTKIFSFTWKGYEALAVLTVAKEEGEKRAYVVYVSPFGQFDQSEVNLEDAKPEDRLQMAKVVELVEAFCEANDYLLYSY